MKTQLKHAAMAAGIALPLMLAARGYADSTVTNDSNSAVGTGSSAPADNSARNKRDRSDSALGSADQGNNREDLDLTRNIRRALVSRTNSFSMTAKNIKVITVNGKVTLRGPVNTESEKSKITSLAAQIAGEGNVTDQLEVKNNP